MTVTPRLIGMYGHCPGRRIDGDGVAGPNDFRNILFETVDHGKIGESRTLRHNRIGVVQQEGERGVTPVSFIARSIHAVATPPFAILSTRTLPL